LAPLSLVESERKQGICRVGINPLIIASETVEYANNKSIKDQEKTPRQDDLQAQMRFSKEKNQKVQESQKTEVQKRITRQKDLQITPIKSQKTDQKRITRQRPANNPKKSKRNLGQEAASH
jgi:hypothetical protein